MTYDEIIRAVEFVRERLAQQDWAYEEYPQIDRDKVIRDINERMARYREMADFSENRSAGAEERNEDDKINRLNQNDSTDEG